MASTKQNRLILVITVLASLITIFGYATGKFSIFDWLSPVDNEARKSALELKSEFVLARVNAEEEEATTFALPIWNQAEKLSIDGGNMFDQKQYRAAADYWSEATRLYIRASMAKRVQLSEQKEATDSEAQVVRLKKRLQEGSIAPFLDQGIVAKASRAISRAEAAQDEQAYSEAIPLWQEAHKHWQEAEEQANRLSQRFNSSKDAFLVRLSEIERHGEIATSAPQWENIQRAKTAVSSDSQSYTKRIEQFNTGCEQLSELDEQIQNDLCNDRFQDHAAGKWALRDDPDNILQIVKRSGHLALANSSFPWTEPTVGGSFEPGSITECRYEGGTLKWRVQYTWWKTKVGFGRTKKEKDPTTYFFKAECMEEHDGELVLLVSSSEDGRRWGYPDYYYRFGW